MKTVLITNLYLQKYTGSELHVIDIANEFKKNNYDVTIAVFSKSYPLLAECEDFKVVELSDKSLDNTKFDILFIQHYPTLDYLKTHYHIQYKHLIISKLSSFNSFETLPNEYKTADLISVVSQECKESILNLTNNIYVFKNSVSDDFFSLPKRNTYSLKNIAIISNHVPEELYALKEQLNEYNVQIIGAGNTPTLVTPTILSNYDLVITIGRTVQQCFAARIPVYVYDHFGGPGYITKENIQKAQDFNFSGRGFNKKQTQEIFQDIINNYENNLSNLSYLNEYAQENFSLTKTFNSMLQIVTNHISNEFKSLKPYNEPENIRIQTYSEMMPFTPYIHADYLNESQFYYTDEANEFNENKSYSWPITNGYTIERHFNVSSNEYIRFDPAKKPCKCKLVEIIIDDNKINLANVTCNRIYNNGSFDFFLTSDSNYIFNSKINKTVTIRYIVQPLNYSDMEIIETEKNKEMKELIFKYNLLCKKTHPIQTINKKIKAHRQ